HPLVVRAGDDVEEVLDDAVGDEDPAAVVPVEPPRVGRPVRYGLEDVPRGMVAPDAAVHRDALVVGRAGLADPRVREDAVAAVEPAIGPPRELAEDVVLRLHVPAVQEDLRRAA